MDNRIDKYIRVTLQIWIMDRESLRAILDNMDARVWEFIDAGASLDEIRDIINHRDDRRIQAMQSYVDAAFAGEEDAEEEEDTTAPQGKTRAGRGEDE